jgi:hypothetical protein
MDRHLSLLANLDGLLHPVRVQNEVGDEELAQGFERCVVSAETERSDFDVANQRPGVKPQARRSSAAVRELQNVVEQAVLVSDGPHLRLGDVPLLNAWTTTASMLLRIDTIIFCNN